MSYELKINNSRGSKLLNSFRHYLNPLDLSVGLTQNGLRPASLTKLKTQNS
jgi:hypothetical protein